MAAFVERGRGSHLLLGGALGHAGIDVQRLAARHLRGSGATGAKEGLAIVLSDRVVVPFGEAGSQVDGVLDVENLQPLLQKEITLPNELV